MAKEAVFTMKLEPELRDAFAAAAKTADPVSYTHLDVYKRQPLRSSTADTRTSRSAVTSCV